MALNSGQQALCRGLFITDFDGTLLRSDATFAQQDLDALKYLSRCGVKTAVATGRSLYSFINSPGIELAVDYIIFSTGAGVVARSGYQLLYQQNLSPELVGQTLGYLEKSTLDFMLHHPVPDNHRYVFRRAGPGNPDFESRLQRYGEFGQPLDAAHRNGFGEASQFLAVVPHDRIHDVLTEVRAALPGLNVIHATSPLDHQSAWIEFFHPGVSKGKTAAWLASELKISTSDTMAVGNDYNDLDLLEWAAHAYVVANAPDDLKAGFQPVASNNDGGVAEAVGSWLEIISKN